MLRRFGCSTTLFIVLSMISIDVVSKSNEPPFLKAEAPTRYTVVEGDTLWGISALYLDDPWLWPKLWKTNPEIENPHLIYPGDRLSLIWRNGQPMLTLKSAVKLSPKMKVLEKRAITGVEESVVLPFLESDELMSQQQLSGAARVLGTGLGEQYLSKQAPFYITNNQAHNDWVIYRIGERFERDDKVIIALKKIAEAKLVERGEKISALEVIKQTQEIRVDDIALPRISQTESAHLATFYPQPSPQDLSTHILGSIAGSDYVVKNQVVVLDRGGNDGLVQGSMFELFHAGEEVAVANSSSIELKQVVESGLQFPSMRVGSMMVIRSYTDFSLALITESVRPITEKTQVLSPSSVNR